MLNGIIRILFGKLDLFFIGKTENVPYYVYKKKESVL